MLFIVVSEEGNKRVKAFLLSGSASVGYRK